MIRTLATIGATLAPPASLFVVQTLLIGRGDFDSVLALGTYAGMLSLVFYLFDGNSGLVYSLAGARCSEAETVASFYAFRVIAGAVIALLGGVALVVAPGEAAVVLPCLIVSLALRFPWLDGELDGVGRHALATALNSSWLAYLALLVTVTGRIDAGIAGLAALLGSLTLTLVRLALRGRHTLSWPAAVPRALPLILSYMFTLGLGQIYGRLVLVLIGSNFSGSFAAMVLYAKQVFNASGLVVSAMRRLEANRAGTSRFRWQDLRLSLTAQVLVALVGTVIVAAACALSGLAALPCLAILAWQLLERASTNATYVLQRHEKHRAAMLGLLSIATLGLLGFLAGVSTGSLAIYLLAECMGFLLVLALLILRTPLLFHPHPTAAR